MDITIAYFHPLLHPEIVKRDFELMRASGASSIVCAIHEQEEQRCYRDLERGLRQAQDAGLKVYLSLSRYGNLFAGPTFMPSWYTFHNPQSRVKDRHGRFHDISCYNHEAFRSWIFKEIEYYLKTYPINGIMIDEPGGPDITCFCSVCRALCPDITDLQHFRRRSMIDFLGELCNCAKRVNPDVKTNVTLLPQDLNLLDELVDIPHLDTIGCHLFWQSLKEDAAKVEEWSQTLVKQVRKRKKKSQLWLQNFNLDQQAEQSLEPTFSKMLAADPDEVACYYYWRNNADPDAVWQTTRRLLKRTPRRQLYWQSTLSSIPVPKVSLSEEQTQLQ
jgi:hypothetical protein